MTLGLDSWTYEKSSISKTNSVPLWTTFISGIVKLFDLLISSATLLTISSEQASCPSHQSPWHPFWSKHIIGNFWFSPLPSLWQQLKGHKNCQALLIDKAQYTEKIWNQIANPFNKTYTGWKNKIQGFQKYEIRVWRA